MISTSRQWAKALLDRSVWWKRKITEAAPGRGSHSPAEIERWMQERIGEALNVSCKSLDPTQPFTTYGLDSITGFTLTSELAEWLERELPADLLWEYPTIAGLARHLGGETETVNGIRADWTSQFSRQATLANGGRTSLSR